MMLATTDSRPATRRRPRLSLIIGAVLAIAALLMLVDLYVGGKAERLYGQAHQVARGQIHMANMKRDVHKGRIIVRAYRVPADVCFVFTGGMHFSMLLPRSLHIQAEHPTVFSASGRCTPGNANTLLFTFSEVNASPR